MAGAAVVIVPSESYETFGRVVIEAFAVGTPVVVSRSGALPELVEPGRTGLCFNPGDPDDLARQLDYLLSRSQLLAEMRREARAEYEAKYTAERNYPQLMAIYQQAIDRAKSSC